MSARKNPKVIAMPPKMQAAAAGVKRCAFYARISPTPEKEFGHNYSIAAQHHEMNEYASARGYQNDLSLQFVDNLVTGAILDRPALNAVRELIRARTIDVLLVLSTDRLSRELAHLLLLDEECQKHGVALEFVKEEFADNAEGRLMFGMKGVLNKYEREKIRDRTTRGRRQRARENHPATGAAPYGFRLLTKRDGSRGELLVNETELPHLRLMFRLASEGLSLRGIARELNARGVASRNKGKRVKVRQDHRKPGEAEFRINTGLWSPEVIQQILKNPAYIGEFRSPESIQVTCPALIDQVTFYAVEQRLKQNLVAKVGRPSKLYLLRGMLWCSKCGSRYIGAPNAGRPLYYCSRRNQRARSVGQRCDGPGVSQRNIERALWAAVWRSITDQQVLSGWMKAYYSEMQTPDEGPRQLLERKLARLEANERRAIEILEDGEVDFARAKRRLGEVRGELVVARAELAAAKQVRKLPAENVIAAWVEKIGAAGEPERFEHRRQILEEVAVRAHFERPIAGTRGGVVHIAGEVYIPTTLDGMKSTTYGEKNCHRHYIAYDNSFLAIPFNLKELVA